MAQSSPDQGASNELQGPARWFVPNLEDIKPEARELFEKYSKVAPDAVVSHITSIRDMAFKIYPYPCLGQWRFLDMSISQATQYSNIVQRIKDGDKYLDIGCCIGQDIRKLVYDGVPSENTYGSDLKKEFMDIGYDLFLDKDKLKTTFIAADVFDPASELTQLDGHIDIIHAASFFHLFDWNEQVQAAKRVAKLLSSKPGGMVVGRQAGNVNAGERPRETDPKQTRFHHNASTFVKLWEQVGEETATKWEVDARLEDLDLAQQSRGIPEGTRWLQFTVRKL